MRIAFVETYLSVFENKSDITLELQLLEGTIAPELGNIVVTVSTSDQTAIGETLNIFCSQRLFMHVLVYSVYKYPSTCTYMHTKYCTQYNNYAEIHVNES